MDDIPLALAQHARAREHSAVAGTTGLSGDADRARDREGAPGTLIPSARPYMPTAASLLPYLERIDEAQWYTNFGALVRELEARVCRTYGLAQGSVVTMSSGTTGLTLALSSLNAPPGALCIVPSWTFCATAHAIVAAGLRPHFVDVDPVTWSVEPHAAADLLARTPGEVAAIVPVAPFGAPVDVTAWDRVTEATGVPVVIDAAAGFDGLVPGRSPAVISLHATKAMAVGEGGLVVSTDVERIRHIRSLSYFGYDGSRASRHCGANGKMSEYHAAVGLAQLDRWAETRRRYLSLAARFREKLQRIAGLAVAPWFGQGFAVNTCNVVVRTGSADGWTHRLEQRGIGTFRWWPEPCHTQPAFRGFSASALPVTETLAERMFGIPFHLSLSEADIAAVLAALRAVGQEMAVLPGAGSPCRP